MYYFKYLLNNKYILKNITNVFTDNDNGRFVFGLCAKKIISAQKANLLIPRIYSCGALTVHCLHFGLIKFTKWLTYSNLWTKHMIFSIGYRYAVFIRVTFSSQIHQLTFCHLNPIGQTSLIFSKVCPTVAHRTQCPTSTLSPKWLPAPHILPPASLLHLEFTFWWLKVKN